MKLCIKFKKGLVKKHELEVIKEFILTLQKSLPLKGELDIIFLDKRKGKMTTGSFKKKENKIKVLFKARMLADILRTLSHEWAHCYDHQKVHIKDRREVGGESENFANAKSGALTKKFVKSNPDLHKDLFK